MADGCHLQMLNCNISVSTDCQ